MCYCVIITEEPGQQSKRHLYKMMTIDSDSVVQKVRLTSPLKGTVLASSVDILSVTQNWAIF